MAINPAYLVPLGIIGIATLVMAYFAQMAVFSPQKLKDYTRSQYERLPQWWPARDLNMRLVENPSFFGLTRAVLVAAFLLCLAIFIFLLVAPGLSS